MNDLSRQNLEAKITFLERHVEQQDKEILRLSQELAIVAKELSALRGKVEDQAEPKNEPSPDERPPHY